MKQLVLSILLLFPAAGFAQTYGRYQTCQLQTALGQAVAGAKVYFLTQPADTTNLVPQANVYANANGTQVQQPILTDGFGQCAAYLLPGVYTVVYISNATGKIVMPDQNIALGGGASFPVPFNIIQSGTNTSAAMHVGSGAVLDTTGTGRVKATDIDGVQITGTPATGQIITATSPTAGTWSNAPASVQSINTVSGPFTFSGTGVSCTGTTCTFSAGGGGSFAPLVNPSGGQNNYAPLINPAFSGGGSINGSSICTAANGACSVIQNTPQYHLFQQPLAGSQNVAGPTNISTDSTGNNLSVPGTILAGGSGTATTYLNGLGTYSTPTGTPAGSNGNVQFNNSSAFGADNGHFGYNSSTHTLTTDIYVSQVGGTGASTTMSSTQAAGNSGSSGTWNIQNSSGNATFSGSGSFSNGNATINSGFTAGTTAPFKTVVTSSGISGGSGSTAWSIDNSAGLVALSTSNTILASGGIQMTSDSTSNITSSSSTPFSINGATGQGIFQGLKLQKNVVNGAGLQIATGTMCAIPAGPLTSCPTTMTLAVTEPDTNYVVVSCSFNATGSGGYGVLLDVRSFTTTTFIQDFGNLASSAYSGGGNVWCLVIHP